MSGEHGIVFALLLDGKGGAREIERDALPSVLREPGALWVHLDYSKPDAGAWLREESGLDPLILEALIAPRPRPRCVVREDGMMVVLRGANANPNAAPDDMVSLRLWIESDRIVSVRHRRLAAVRDLTEALAEGRGPTNAGAFLATIVELLAHRMSDAMDALDDRVDLLEERVVAGRIADVRADIADARRQIVSFRRHVAPQRDLLSRLHAEPVSWLSGEDRARIHEVTERAVRHLEGLDAARDRAAVTQEELNGRISERTNRTLYVLSVITALFLPIGFVTELLGVNVGGVPGQTNPWAFLQLCAMLGVVAVVEILLLKALKWI